MYNTLSCPFCGKNSVITDSEQIGFVNGSPSSLIKRMWAKCTNCGAQGPKTVNEVVYPSDEEASAVVAWNRRAS